MEVSSDPSKEVQEVILSTKITKITHRNAFFNYASYLLIFSKHLGMYLDEKLTFNHHFKENILVWSRIDMIKKLSNTISQNSLLTIYKAFVRPISTMVK